MIGALINHLWQSTLFALMTGLIAVAFRQNLAAVRYGLWLSGSIKFLVPFAVLSALGSYLPCASGMHRIVAPTTSLAIARISRRFLEARLSGVPPIASTPGTPDWFSLAIVGMWACGCVAMVFMRFRMWRRILARVRVSTPLEIPGLKIAERVPLRCAPGLLEPGVFGCWRPVVLMPSGIEAYLSSAQLEAVLAHELCHIRRRDNATAAIHMFVEAVFWFHPLVWWIGARLVEERERACDEDVLRTYGAPLIYAEGLLNVCKCYVEGPLVCVSGVSGSNLRARIEAVMANRIGLRLNLAGKIALSILGTAAIALPVAMGVLVGPGSYARSRPQFERASATTNSGTKRNHFQPSAERFVGESVTVKMLVQRAYNVRALITGRPSLLRERRKE